MKQICSTRPALAFIVLTFGITIGGFFVHELGTHGIIPRTRIFDRIAAAAPSLAALVLTSLLYGREGLKTLLHAMLPWNGRWIWLLLGLFLPLGIALARVPIFYCCGFEVPPAQLDTYPAWIWSVITISFLRAGIAEEVGWRGFLQPHFEKSNTLMVSSIYVGLVWAIWHYPRLFIIWGYDIPSMSFLAPYTIAIIAMGVIFGIVYAVSGRSLFVVILMHGSWDASTGYVPRQLFAGNDWHTSYIAVYVTTGTLCVSALLLAAIYRNCLFARPDDLNDRSRVSGECSTEHDRLSS